MRRKESNKKQNATSTFSPRMLGMALNAISPMDSHLRLRSRVDRIETLCRFYIEIGCETNLFNVRSGEGVEMHHGRNIQAASFPLNKISL